MIRTHASSERTLFNSQRVFREDEDVHGKNAALIRKYYPNYQSPKRVYERLLEATVTPDTVWLDVGCGRRLTGNNELNQSLAQRARFIVGCDRDPHLKRHETVRHLVLCDAAALPLATKHSTSLLPPWLPSTWNIPNACLPKWRVFPPRADGSSCSLQTSGITPW